MHLALRAALDAMPDKVWIVEVDGPAHLLQSCDPRLSRPRTAAAPTINFRLEIARLAAAIDRWDDEESSIAHPQTRRRLRSEMPAGAVRLP